MTLLIILAGGVGAATRFILDGYLRTAVGRNFPWSTIIINILGSFVLGLTTGSVISANIGYQAELVIGTGFCGGFTTFSTASFEAVRLIEERRLWSAVFHILVTLGLTFVFAGFSLWLAS